MREWKWRLVGRLLDHTAEAVMITDPATHIIYVNRSFTKVTGYTLKDVAGKTPQLLHSGRQTAAFYAHMWESLDTSGQWQGEIWNRRKNGEIYPEWLSITAIRGRTRRIENYLGIFSDISLRKREEHELYVRATHDALTDLPNRFLFGEQFRHAMVRAKRAGHRVSLLYVDLDRFKPVNDALGHDRGDMVLRGVAKRLKQSVREEDTVARLGGDEFAVILERLSRPQDARATARKILRALARPFPLGRRKVRIAASIGISIYPDDGEDVDTLLKRADAAMYRTKIGRGNAYRFWGEAPAARQAYRTGRKVRARKGSRGAARPDSPTPARP